jgi:hypothetical protein
MDSDFPIELDSVPGMYKINSGPHCNGCMLLAGYWETTVLAEVSHTIAQSLGVLNRRNGVFLRICRGRIQGGG